MSSKEVKIKITGDISDLIKKLEIVKDSFEELGKNKSTNKGINSLIDDLTDVNKKAEQVQDSLTDLNNTAKKTNSSGLNDMKNDLSDIDKKSDLVTDSFKDLNKQIKDTDNTGLKNISESMTDIADIGEEVKDLFVDCGKLIDSFTGEEISLDASGSTNNITSSITSGFIEGTIAGRTMSNVLSGITEELINLSNIENKTANNGGVKEQINDYKHLSEAVEEYKERLEHIKNLENKLKNRSVNNIDSDFLSNLTRDEIEKEIEIIKADLDAAYRELEETLKSIKESYGNLVRQIAEVTNKEKDNILVKEKLVKIIDDVSKSLKELGIEVEGIPSEAFDKITDKAENFLNTLKDSGGVVKFDYLEKDLKYLGENIDDKTKKLLRFKEMNTSLDGSTKRSIKSIEELSNEFIDSSDASKQSAESIEKQNKALKEYISLANDAGKEISKAYMNEDGSLDVAKYMEDLVKYGKPLNQLTMKFQSLKEQVLEYAKIEDESIENKAKAIRAINEQAEALRRLGAQVNDISRSDIAEFDQSLASQLDNTFNDLFDSDIPETFSQMVDEIRAAWQELNNLEFGNAMNLAGNALRGFAQQVVSRIPAQVKVAVVAITALIAAINKLYQVGKQNFLEGLSNIGNKLQPIVDIVKSFGQEVKAAFEDITNTQLDLSSLMAIGPKFEYQMQRVGSIAGSNTQQLKKLTDEAERLGGSTQFTASQVAEAFEYMARHTWSVMEKSIA